METKKTKIPSEIRIAGLLLSLIAFAVGFWHTHLGLKEMRPFESDYGSIIIATIILLLLLISYFFAVSGKKVALVFYLICAAFFIVFNLNYFYPSYLGRQLVKEEAIELNMTLQSFSNKLNLIDKSNIAKVSELHSLQEKIYDEIKRQSGFGPRATDYLRQFNDITKGSLKANIRIGQTQEEREEIALAYNKLLEKEIENYVIKQMADGNAENANKLYQGIIALDTLNKYYSPLLKEIIADDSRVPFESLKTHPQITILQNMVTDLDDATIKINEASNQQIFPKLNEAKTRNLGRIAHTLSSIKERINHIDTWAMILLCLFIDLIVPLAIYILIRQKEGETIFKGFRRDQNINTK